MVSNIVIQAEDTLSCAHKETGSACRGQRCTLLLLLGLLLQLPAVLDMAGLLHLREFRGLLAFGTPSVCRLGTHQSGYSMA